jgi:hypothetical protein
MINTNHRKKLIDGLVIAMGKPKMGKPMDEGTPEEESAESPADESDESKGFAEDAMRAIDEKDPMAFAEAIKSICEGMSK